ncbi:type II toxin-antitoxin system HicB family antitoxin [bacterium]|jgi:predicted RNase H-like HicB family nuclease|nr:type II toxin-antitoxin system HicB family antitoxin [Verrucomicrobiota bacterium]MDA7633185.1 type II toxin-antitoxin system HicB family antitoxin [bacterium]
MNLKVIVHKAVEGGFRAEVPAIPGCVSQGVSMDESKENVQEAIVGCLSVELDCDQATMYPK